LLTPLRNASMTLSGILKKGGIVVYESTEYPGAAEEFFIPVLEKGLGLKFNENVFVGYSRNELIRAIMNIDCRQY
jgi:UDP-N-acetyl-D-galactosamine dehydrogenase